MVVAPGNGERTATPHESFDSPFYNRFRNLLRWCVHHRWITIGLTLLTFALGIAGMGRVQQQFFPDSSRPEIMVDLWFPEGTSIVANEEVTRRVEQRLMGESGIASVSTWIGSCVPRFYLPIDQIFPQSNVSQLIVIPTDLKVREAFRVRLPALLAQEFPEARARIKLLANGPPVAYPVQFRVAGPEPHQLRTYADSVKAVMRENRDMRRVAWRYRADGHDPAQFGDPDRPDRTRPGGGHPCLGRDHREHGAALAPHRFDSGRGGAGDDSPIALGFLGTHGGVHHGRTGRRHRAHAAGAAGDVRGLVPGAAGAFGCRLKLRVDEFARGGLGGHPYLFSGAGGEIGRRTRFRS